MKREALISVVLLLVVNLFAQEVDPFDPDLGRPVMVRVQIEYVQVSQAKYLELMSIKRGTADATPIRKRLQEMVARDEAKVLETGMVVGRSGEKATVESIGEHIYPIEYEPPFLPGTFTGELLKADPIPSILKVPTIATSFETRNVGSTLEIATNIGANNRVIDLNFAPELVFYVGDTVHMEERDIDGAVYPNRHPLFVKQAVTTAITCIDGQYNLVTTLTPPGEDGKLDPGQKLMVFVKCDILVVKEATE